MTCILLFLSSVTGVCHSLKNFVLNTEIYIIYVKGELGEEQIIGLYESS